MRRRPLSLLLNLATAASLALALASFSMSVRSEYVTEGWESKPRPSGMLYGGSGYHAQWAVESAKGRLVFVSYRMFIRSSPYDPPNSYRYDSHVAKWVKLPGDLPIASGHYRSAQARTPERQSRYPTKYPANYDKDYPHSGFRVPGVRWYEKIGGADPGWFLGVSWHLIGCAGLILPAAWAVRKWGRPLRPLLRRRGFPVISN